MDTIAELQAAFDSGDHARASAALDVAVRTPPPASELTDYLFQRLASATDARLRNAVAIALADLARAGHPIEHRLVAAIGALLAEPATRGARGTLLFALADLDTRAIAQVLIEVAIDDTFEASREALLRLESMDGPLAADVLEACEQRARAALASAPQEKRAWLEEVVALFDV